MTCIGPVGDRVDQDDARSRLSSAILSLFPGCSASGQNAFLVNQVLRAWDSIISPTGRETHEPHYFFSWANVPKIPKHETGNHDDQVRPLSLQFSAGRMNIGLRVARRIPDAFAGIVNGTADLLPVSAANRCAQSRNITKRR
jgi:hypothetical protein